MAVERPRGRRRPVFLAGLAVSIVAATWFGSSWVPRPVAREAAIWALRSIRIAHGLAWPVAAAGAVGLGARVVRGRRAGCPRPGSARGLLAFGSTLIGLAGLDLAALAYQARAHRVVDRPRIVPDAWAKSARPADLYLVVLGESSALGEPYAAWLSVGRIVEWQLRPVFPDRNVRVDVLAEPGATLERAVARFEVLPRKPDAVIVYSGHNEVSGRFPLGRATPHYLDEVTPLDRLSARVASVSPLDRMLLEGIDSQGKDGPPRVERRRLVDVPACGPAEFAGLRRDFRARLEALVVGCVRSGILPILIIPPGNDGGFEPNRSVLDPSTPRADRESFEREFRAIRAAEEADAGRARESYRSILARHPGFAEAHFRLARLLERSGAFDEANRHYILARDLDGPPIRCTTDLEDGYRAASTRGDCILIDGPAVLRKATRHGILDGRVLHDAQHPTLIGHVALAGEILARLKARGAFGWPPDRPAPALDPAECAAHFGMDPLKWAYVCYYSQVMYLGSCGLRFEDAERREAARRYAAAIQFMVRRVPPEKLGLLGDGVIPGVTSTPR